jgi:hypothetical protein
MADYDLQYQDTHIDALLATANELKTAGYIYKGVATPSTNPGTPTERVAYLASEPGTYTNFGGIVIASGLYSLTYAGGTWTGTQMSAGSDIEVVQTTGQSTSDVMSQKAVTDEMTENYKPIDGGSISKPQIGIWDPDTGYISSTAGIRANLQISAIGYRHIRIQVPADYYIRLYYIDANRINLGEITTDWLNGIVAFDISGEHDLMVNIKYQTAGTTKITQTMINKYANFYSIYMTKPNTDDSVASNDELQALKNIVVGEQYIINKNLFISGTNDASGGLIKGEYTRIILADLLDISTTQKIRVKANGMKYVILTYDSTGVYEDATGWVVVDGTYSFAEDKKIRVLIAKLDNSTISVEENVVEFAIVDSEGLTNDFAKVIEAEGNDVFYRFNKKVIVYNPYKDHPTNQYKGQMHCHSTNSDGALAPAAVVAKYVGYGYDFMTITDHNYITPNPSPNADIVWMGNSYEDTWNSAGHQHMNVWNCTEVINRVNAYTTSNTPLMLVNHYVKQGDSVLSYNHPEYPPVYASDDTLANLPIGISFVEIYNSTIQTYLGVVDALPSTANYGDMVEYNGTRYINTSTTKASPNWQATTESANPDGNLDRGFRIMLDRGHKVFCDAVDDFHRGDNMENRGWQMVFAHSRTKQSIWNGLLKGASYASTGVSLNDVSFVDGVYKIDIANGENAVTTFYGYNNEVLGTSNGSTATYEATGNEKYIRAMVVIDGKKAWTQPVWIIAKDWQFDL